jgi:hypothetical protein|tara:strand:+ start:368 stop:787 length:420 start_codon:yes stop_codon:yes gene_type:complete
MNGDLNNIIEVVKEVTGLDPKDKSCNKAFSKSKQIYVHIAKSLNYRPSEIANHIGMSLAQVYRHIKTFERISQRNPELRSQTESCWFKVNNMLKIENFNFLDRLMFFWDDLTIKQREEITELAEKYHVNNAHAKQEIYV